jgi:hypothetical protein
VARAERARRARLGPRLEDNMKRASPPPKGRRRNSPGVASPQAKRRQRSAKVAVRRGTTLLESTKTARHMETRMAPPRYAERQHARPGAGIKRSRANMAPKPRGR